MNLNSYHSQSFLTINNDMINLDCFTDIKQDTKLLNKIVQIFYFNPYSPYMRLVLGYFILRQFFWALDVAFRN